MFHVAKILVVALLISTVSAQVPRNEYHYAVVGRAVDRHGQPVPFARIVMAPGHDNKGGDFIYTGSADAQGRIHFEVNDSTLEKPTRILFVTAPPPPNTVTLIEPPFDEYPLTDPSYAPQHILIQKNGQVDIGDVPVQVSYHVVKVVLQDRFGKPLLKNAEAWRKLALEVRDQRGRFMEETSITERRIKHAVNLSESSLSVSLPEGEWRIEISPGEGEEWLTSDVLLDVKASNPQLQLTLKAR